MATGDEIPGWFDFQDVYTDAVHRADRYRPSIFVEIGAWFGKSTRFLAERIRDSGKPIRLFVVDTWEGSPNEPHHLAVVQQHGGSIFSAFCDFLGELAPWVIPLRMSSHVAPQFFHDASVEFVFVDGCHEFDHVRQDLRLWIPKVARGGILAGHDYGWSAVRCAVEDLIPTTEIRGQGGSWVWKKDLGHDGRWIRPLPAAEHSLSSLLVASYPDPCGILKSAARQTLEAGTLTMLIDNSRENLETVLAVAPASWGIYRPQEKLRSAQRQNLARGIALHEQAQWMVILPATVECLDDGVVRDLLNHGAAEDHDRCGVVTTAEYGLAAYSVTALRDAGVWDESLEPAAAEYDYLRRLQLRGWSRLTMPSMNTGYRVRRLGRPAFAESGKVQSPELATYQQDFRQYIAKWGGNVACETFPRPYNV